MTYTQRYEAELANAERLARKKIQREDGLRRLYSNQDQVKDAFTIDGLIAMDTLVKEYQLLYERSIAAATAYGMGAVMDTIMNRRGRRGDLT